MTVTFKLNDFFYTLFPNLIGGGNELIINELKKYYSYGSVQPDVEIKDDWVIITLDSSAIASQEKDIQKVVVLCENKQYDTAKPLLEKLIQQNPTHSEFHRVLGQIHEEQGRIDDAINALIDALRWDNHNEWALIMMGNIFAKHQKDIDTALVYYNQVLTVNPDNYLALNNMGSNLMNAGKTEEAKKYFHQALQANPNYPNTHHALALVNQKEGDLDSAFQSVLQAIKQLTPKDNLYPYSVKLALELAQQLTQNNDGLESVQAFVKELEAACGKPIKVEADEQIVTAAKIEFAETYRRDFHLVKYKASHPAVAHLILHELMHLELVNEARATGENQLFTTTKSLKTSFLETFKSFKNKLRNKGIPEENISRYMQALFDGINSQVYNTPIDLFIEDRIYQRFPNMRAQQFLSLFALNQEGIQATTQPDIVENSPKRILSNSKIYNLINALHFKTLYGVDVLAEFKSSKIELNQAQDLYNEFLEYRDDKAPAEEYELVQHWAEDLKLDGFFELVPEDPQQRKTVDDVLAEIENDPYGLESKDPSKERKMKKFLDSHRSEDINQAVAMYMVGALEFFKPMAKAKVKELAFEFATLGMSGIDPQKDNYSIPSIKNKTFTGYQALAYYYVSWAIAIPEMLAQLQMPFEKEYELAKQMTEL